MNNRLKQLWQNEENAVFQGWDFSHLDGRWEVGELPWDYKGLIAQYLKPNDVLLDMGTGGGEFILSINHTPDKIHVTESYKPNIDYCLKHLKPLGISVHPVKDDKKLPFESNTFDIIINRHESFDTHEVLRILKPNGFFITQQVGGRNNISLSNKLIDNFIPRYPLWNLNTAKTQLKVNGVEILYSDEYFPELRFFDVGAVVYFAKAIEWEFPGFSVDTHLDKLKILHEEIKQNGYVSSTEHRFVVVVRK